MAAKKTRDRNDDKARAREADITEIAGVETRKDPAVADGDREVWVRMDEYERGPRAKPATVRVNGEPFTFRPGQWQKTQQKYVNNYSAGVRLELRDNPPEGEQPGA